MSSFKPQDSSCPNPIIPTDPMVNRMPGPARRTGPKMLEWVKPTGSLSLHRADTAIGTYRTWTHHEANGKWFWEFATIHGASAFDAAGPSEAEVRAAAQAHFDRTVRDCLDTDAGLEDAQRERDELRAAIFGGADYSRDLRNGNFIEMARLTEAARLGAIARAEVAEAALAAQNERSLKVFDANSEINAGLRTELAQSQGMDGFGLPISINLAPVNNTMVRLLVEWTPGADVWAPLTDDLQSWTFGFNGFEDTGENVWQYVGWSWSRDCFHDCRTDQGFPKPVGWLPLPAALAQPAVDTDAAEEPKPTRIVPGHPEDRV